MPIKGNTPAYAGKTHLGANLGSGARKHPRLRGEDRPNADRGNDGREKHPRLRGEDTFVVKVFRAVSETPPLTRGRPSRKIPTILLTRNTPAYAGKTVGIYAREMLLQKHPRLRGEDYGRVESGREKRRNTPAYAGKTSHHSIPFSWLKKHPRLRGEDPKDACSQSSAPETPPLTRGRLKGESIGADAMRNTPAYAGKTRPSSRSLRKGLETPPLTRGRRPALAHLGEQAGNTPAYAGKTVSWLKLKMMGRKHPRLRGEDASWRLKRASRVETPPLTRGRPLFHR